MRSWRFLRHNRALAAAASPWLGRLGLGGNLTICGVVRGWSTTSALPIPRGLVRSGQHFLVRYRELAGAGILEDIAFYRSFSRPNWRSGDHSEMTWALQASPNFFQVLGVPAPRLKDGAAVVSYAFWKRRLGGDPRAIGQPLELNGRLFYAGGRAAGGLPQRLRHEHLARDLHAGRDLEPRKSGLDRLRPSARRPIARGGAGRGGLRRAAALGRRVRAPVRGPPPHGRIRGSHGSGRKRLLPLLRGAFRSGRHDGPHLLRQCGRTADRARPQPPPRDGHSQGAGRQPGGMARPLLAKASVLAAAGAAAGLLLEWFLASRLRLVRFPSAYGVPFEFHFRGDSGLLLYAAAAALVALAVSTLGPALSASRADLAWAIRQGEPALSLRRWNLRSVFVAVQMALAVMLLAVGALFVRSFAHVATADLGFDAAHILMAGTQPAPGTPSDYRERVLRGMSRCPAWCRPHPPPSFRWPANCPKSSWRRARCIA